MPTSLNSSSYWDSDKLKNVSESLKDMMQQGMEEKAGYASVLLKSLREEVKKFDSDFARHKISSL